MGLTDFPKIVGAFEKNVPYVKVQRQPVVTVFALYQDRQPRHGPGVSAVDVVGSAPIEMWELKQRGYSAAYLSPELKAFPRGFLRSARLLVVDRGDAAGARFQYATWLSPEEAPRRLSGSASPKWKGKMNFGSDEYAWYSVMLDGMGKAKGLEYMQALARQQLHIPGWQQHHALATHARRRVCDRHRRARAASD